MKNKDLLDDIIELQSLAQSGLYYGHDAFDLERYQRIRELACDMLAICMNEPIVKMKNVFCHEEGYQTPKLDTRAVIFNTDGQLLLVQENDGLWSLPGGWVDINTSIKENTEKEVKEEAGLNVQATKIIAIMDRDKHNLPRYLYKVIKVFVMCEVISGQFEKNIETLQFQYFTLDNLPPLATAKNNLEQIQMCFDAYQNKTWKTYFD